jgi:DNA-binding CsgD family transcriptional regulator
LVSKEAQVKQLVKKGLSARAIAQNAGISMPSVYILLKRLGLSIRKKSAKAPRPQI